jgi:hypothetical protein
MNKTEHESREIIIWRNTGSRVMIMKKQKRTTRFHANRPGKRTIVWYCHGPKNQNICCSLVDLKSPFTNDYGKELKSLCHPKGQAFLKFFLDYRPRENIQRSCCADQYIFCSTLSVRNLLALSIKELAGWIS